MSAAPKTPRPKPLLNPDAYTIGIVCALEKEAIAVQSTFDHFFLDKKEWPKTARGDGNSYSFGTICDYHVVVAQLADMGGLEAKEVAKDMQRSFPNIKLCLVVGICGIVPKIGKEEAVLGDIVISREVIQYTRGKDYPSGFHCQNMLHKASDAVIRGFEKLGTPEPWEFFCRKADEHLRTLMEHKSIKARAFGYPGRETDVLYNTKYIHRHHNEECTACTEMKYCQNAVESSCDELGCSEKELVFRKRARKIEEPTAAINGMIATITTLSSNVDASFLPQIYLGKVASGDKVMKNGAMRNLVAQNESVIAFETEGAGVWSTFPTVVIKAGCDYADSHKNKKWQEWASMTAASCAKAFLGQLQMGIPENVEYVTNDGGETKKYNLGLNLFNAPNMTEGFFIGRYMELQKMEKILNPQSSFLASTRKVLILGGMGGIGKTQLAIAYAQQHRTFYSSILWLNATSETTLRASLRNVAHRIFCPETVSKLDDDQACICVSNWLSEPGNHQWLVILDNYDDPGQFDAADYYPSVAQGSIIITTRSPEDIEGEPIKIRHMTD